MSSIIFLVLLFILGHTLAVAPGDEDDDGCAVPNYPDNIKVLMDSWRYQTLLPSTWTATNSDSNNEDTVGINNITVCMCLNVVHYNTVDICWWNV